MTRLPLLLTLCLLPTAATAATATATAKRPNFVFLVSEAASFVMGTILYVDGGCMCS